MTGATRPVDDSGPTSTGRVGRGGPTDDAGADLVAVGRIGPARGVRGEVFVQPFTDAPDERFRPGAVLTARPESAGPLEVQASSTSGGKLVVHFAGVEGRPAAEALHGIELFIARGARPTLQDPDEFYDSDLIGLSARTVDGEVLGPVVEVVHAGGADHLVVRVDGRDRLVPFVAAIVVHVDVAEGSVEIDAPPGLFDL